MGASQNHSMCQLDVFVRVYTSEIVSSFPFLIMMEIYVAPNIPFVINNLSILLEGYGFSPLCLSIDLNSIFSKEVDILFIDFYTCTCTNSQVYDQLHGFRLTTDPVPIFNLENTFFCGFLVKVSFYYLEEIGKGMRKRNCKS